MSKTADIDRLLLSCCDAHWRKVARIIGQTCETLEAREFAISGGIAKLMDARMAVLVRSGKLEAKGYAKYLSNKSLPRLPYWLDLYLPNLKSAARVRFPLTLRCPRAARASKGASVETSAASFEARFRRAPQDDE